MKAFVYHGDTKFSIDEVPMPKAGPGEAIAKIRCASICGTDLRTYRFGNAKLETPIIMGHEACYEIVEADPATGLKVGGRYIMAPAIGCGECKSCKKGRTNMCDTLKSIGFQFDGTFAEYIRIPELAIRRGHLIPIPDSISDTAASVVEPVACAVNAQTYLKIEKGDNVLIYGSGYLGCIHAELAYIQGAAQVIIAEISESRRKSVKQFVPNVQVVDSGDPGYMDTVRQMTGGGVDVVITAAPAGITHRQGLELLYKNGRMSLFGGLPGTDNYHIDSNLIHYKELGVFGAHASTVAQNKQVLDMVVSGKLNVEKYITVFAFSDIDKAFESVVTEKAVKAVVIP